MTFALSYKTGGGGPYTGMCQGMVFGLLVLNRVIIFCVCPEQVVFLVICPKQGPKMKGVLLNRVGIFGLFLVLNMLRVSNPQRQPYTQTWAKCPRGL